MLAAPELRSIVDAAEQAAAGGDHASAERLLRDALRLQESTLGARHPDLANTLNNIGVVCEMAGKPVEAEHSYRRAYEIATAALAADDPAVATSRKNLEDFCNARGIPVDPPAAEPLRMQLAGPSEVSPPAHGTSVAVAPVVRSSRGLVVGVLVVAVLALALFVALRPAAPPPQVSESGDATSTSGSGAASSPAPETPVTSPKPAPTKAPVVPAKAASTRNDGAAAANTRAPGATAAAPTVISAELCRNPPSGNWRCNVVSGSVGPSTLFFYTRVASTSGTTVEHRWYQGDRLHQTIALRVQASTGGFRTYSRNTVAPDRAGNWRVELRAQDGRVLHEERFTVR